MLRIVLRAAEVAEVGSEPMHTCHRVDRQIAGYKVRDALVLRRVVFFLQRIMYTALLCLVVLIVVFVVGGVLGKLPGTRAKSLPPGEYIHRCHEALA